MFPDLWMDVMRGVDDRYNFSSSSSSFSPGRGCAASLDDGLGSGNALATSRSVGATRMALTEPTCMTPDTAPVSSIVLFSFLVTHTEPRSGGLVPRRFTSLTVLLFYFLSLSLPAPLPPRVCYSMRHGLLASGGESVIHHRQLRPANSSLGGFHICADG
ncbi:hypothetical protein LZ32DRAFT_128810 [Colletotrichum eremochloae]|nr:hypothetical protein LZ32DRAFT_128810 [Colletotrichum eremochloae]